MSDQLADDNQSLLDVVIVNWNTGDCLRACLRSLSAAAAGLRLGPTVVVDNASSDESVNQLQASSEVVLIRNPTNIGFAAACNQGARVGSAPFVLFLNPDTELLPGTLRAAIGFLDSPEGAPYGICGALVLHDDGTPGISASRFPTLANVVTGTLRTDRLLRNWVPPRHLLPDELVRSGPVDQVIGAFFLVRRSLFDRLGGFDERYFVYYEEVDFCRRAAALGESVYLLTEARLHHVGNVSAKRSGGRALFYSLRSRTLYAARHWPTSHVLGLLLFTLTVELPLRMLQATLRMNSADMAVVGRAFAWYVGFLAHSGKRPKLLGKGATTAGQHPSAAELTTSHQEAR